MTTPTPSPEPKQPKAVPEEKTSPPPATVGNESELRELVTQIMKETKLDFDAGTYRKGKITAITTGTPPTLSANISGDTATTVTGIRWFDGYAPQVGDTIIIAKQRSEILALGKIADNTSAGWTQATLQSGFTHSNSVKYRRVWDNGDWKMQWQGVANRSSGNVIVSALGTDFRPSTNRLIPAAHGPYYIYAETNGDIEVYWDDSHGHSDSFSVNSNTDLAHAHSHGGQVSSTSFAETHSHGLSGSVGNPSRDPSYVSFDGVEYFL